jgi:hypothetical protein
MSDDLIAQFSTDLRPVAPAAMRNRLLMWLAAGVVLSAVLMLAWLGLRPDLAVAVGRPVFWAKFAFTLALTVLGFAAAVRLARPGGRLRGPAIGAFAVIAVTGAAGIVQIVGSAPGEIRTLVVGGSALLCPFYIVALSVPVLALSFVVMRRLAPTNLPAAGFAAGLLSGAAGAWVYAFHCTESGLPFIAIWYTAGILATALIGAVLGRWLLRW